MVKIILAALSAFLALQYTQGIDMGRCAQLAIAKGVPELGIPSHDPLHLTRNISIHRDNFLGKNFTFILNDIIWTNLPWWEVRKNVITKNTTELFDVSSQLWWDNFTASFDYYANWGEQTFKGNVEFVHKDVTWDADYEETRPDSQGIRELKYLHLKQKLGNTSVKTTGFGVFSIVADTLLRAASNFVTNTLVNEFDLFGILFEYRINKVWYGNLTVYNNLVKWCKDQNVPMQLY